MEDCAFFMELFKLTRKLHLPQFFQVIMFKIKINATEIC